jgi:integrase
MKQNGVKMIKTKLNKPKGSRFWKLFVEKDGKYKIIYKNENKQLVKKKRAAVQSDSIDIEAKLSRKTFIGLYKEFAEAKIEEGKNNDLGGKLHSLKVYLGYYNKHISKHFPEHILIDGVTEQVAEDFFIKLKGNGVSWIQTENVVMTFKTALRYAKKKQYISSIGDMEDFKCKKQARLKPKNPAEMKYKKTPMINLQEADRLFKLFDTDNIKNPTITDKRNFVIVAVFLFCGLRMSELRGLKWNAIDLNAEVPTITIKHTIVGSYEGFGKADGSRRTIVIHPVLLQILREWKATHTRHFTPHKITWVFPSLRKTIEWIVPVCERTIRDMINVGFANLDLAEIQYVVDRTNPSKRRIKVISSKFGTAPTKTFRHFAATCLLAGQNSNAELTDKFVINYIGHTDKKVTESIYGDHTNLNTSPEYAAKELQALKNAIPLKRGNY